VVALSVAAAVIAGCGGDAADTAGEGRDTSNPVDSTAPTSTSHPPTETTTADPAASGASGVVAFEVPSQVTCTAGTTAVVAVSYRTKGLQAVGLVVDGQTQPAGETAPSGDGAEVAGTATVTLPCDGNVHTIMLIGSGTDGPAFASKAVVTGAA